MNGGRPAVAPLRRLAIDRARAGFLRACMLDVGVRKPGNVSLASPGHGMTADLFVAAARAACDPLFAPGARVGERIEAAVAASWAVAGCNTNLGIVLLCAPVAREVDLHPEATGPQGLRTAIDAVLAALDLADAQAAFRAIAQARPGGLGEAPEQDVRGPASVDLRAAMALAAPRDSIARLYRDGYGALFAALAALPGRGELPDVADPGAVPDARTVALTQRLFLALLAGAPDSHIVRKHGVATAQTVMAAAQHWARQAHASHGVDADPAFAAWDASLKAQRINPGTTADMTVAALLLAALTAHRPGGGGAGWHGT